ncbi:MAG: dual specificity protein phosphatase family protein [archaeon]|nr:dual specificity protein phosphatase family protein [archaeon]
MYWITKNLATASLPELEDIKKLNGTEIVAVTDLADGKQKSPDLFDRKVQKVEKIINDGKRAVVICAGGMSRSNSVAMAYLVKNSMNFNEAYDLIRKKVPIAQINMALFDHIKSTYKR